MKWTVLNAFGGLAWLEGIVYAKGAPAGAYDLANDHHLLIGAAIGGIGLALLLWTNLRSAL